jgi:hypothetical protein
VPVNVIARSYGVSATLFNRLLHAIGVQFKYRGRWILRRQFNDKGYAITKNNFTCWTHEGRRFIYTILSAYDIWPDMLIYSVQPHAVLAIASGSLQ